MFTWKNGFVRLAEHSFHPASNRRRDARFAATSVQYIGHNGQQWTTLTRMQIEGFRNEFKEHEPGLIGIGTTPTFAIGERALLVQSTQGNILWDCMSLIDEETFEGIEKLGGLKAIAISRPHYYSTGMYWAVDC